MGESARPVTIQPSWPLSPHAPPPAFLRLPHPPSLRSLPPLLWLLRLLRGTPGRPTSRHCSGDSPVWDAALHLGFCVSFLPTPFKPVRKGRLLLEAFPGCSDGTAVPRPTLPTPWLRPVVLYRPYHLSHINHLSRVFCFSPLGSH